MGPISWPKLFFEGYTPRDSFEYFLLLNRFSVGWFLISLCFFNCFLFYIKSLVYFNMHILAFCLLIPLSTISNSLSWNISLSTPIPLHYSSVLRVSSLIADIFYSILIAWHTSDWYVARSRINSILSDWACAKSSFISVMWSLSLSHSR
jgi:hypothetical protein